MDMDEICNTYPNGCTICLKLTKEIKIYLDYDSHVSADKLSTENV